MKMISDNDKSLRGPGSIDAACGVLPRRSGQGTPLPVTGNLGLNGICPRTRPAQIQQIPVNYD